MKNRGRLRTRLVRAFLVVASSAVLVSVSAIWIVDRSIRAEIDQRTTSVERAVMAAIEERGKEVTAATNAVAKDRALVDLANDPGKDALLERLEPLASQLAAAYRLDLLAIVHGGEIVSSAHLPSSIGDPLELPRAGSFGFGEELVSGNPPKPKPAVLAVAEVADGDGNAAIAVLGGSFVDGRLFGPLASAAEARVTLKAPSGVESYGAPIEGASRTMKLGSLEGQRPASLEIRVSADRLREARRRLLMTSGLFVGFAGLLALGLAESRARAITRPIEALSDAAREVGTGRTDVRVDATGDGEVGVLISTFEAMVAELGAARDRIARAERVAAWREAARRIAHEIKNPLTPMRMSMETLRKAYAVKHPELDEIVDESTKAVLDEVKSLERLVSEFSEFARLPSPKRSPLSVKELFEHTARLYGSDLGRTQVRIAERTGLDEAPLLSADRELLGRALINLVKNAVEAIGERGGTVTLDVEVAVDGAKGPGVVLLVKDDGPGMSEEVLKRIFTPYFTTKEQGTGLGLSIVERIIAEHDGTIEIESVLGEGTELRLWLPAG